MEYIKNVLKKEEFSLEQLMVNEIEAVGPGQSYIGRMRTLKNFRQECWDPELFTHYNLGQWIDLGSRSIKDYANEIAKKKIASHSYHIDEDISRELDRIY